MANNEISLYETRRMMSALEQIPPAPMFLRNNFFRNVIKSDTDTIDIDIVNGGRRVVPYVRPVQQGVVMERGGYETKSYKMPYIKIKRPSEAGKYTDRSFGETVYSGESPATRAAKEFVKDLKELNDNLDAEEERQAASAIFTGKQLIRNEDGVIFHEVDFGLKNIDLSGNIDFSAMDFNDILEYYRNRRRVLIKSGKSPTDIIVAPDVGDILIKKFNPSNENSHISSIRIDRGQIDIRNLEDGVTCLGSFTELGCDIYIYDGTYIDLDGTEKQYAPQGMSAMLSRHARFDRYYGAVKNFYAGLVATERFPHSWITEDGSVRILQLESAPLLAPHQVDSIDVAKVL